MLVDQLQWDEGRFDCQMEKAPEDRKGNDSVAASREYGNGQQTQEGQQREQSRDGVEQAARNGVAVLP